MENFSVFLKAAGLCFYLSPILSPSSALKLQVQHVSVLSPLYCAWNLEIYCKKYQILLFLSLAPHFARLVWLGAFSYGLLVCCCSSVPSVRDRNSFHWVLEPVIHNLLQWLVFMTRFSFSKFVSKCPCWDRGELADLFPSLSC